MEMPFKSKAFIFFPTIVEKTKESSDVCDPMGGGGRVECVFAAMCEWEMCKNAKEKVSVCVSVSVSVPISRLSHFISMTEKSER